ncbi:MAG: hypothetical protein ACPG5U_02670 [Planktomarina sp.]
MTPDALNQAILDAHDRDDRNGLVRFYGMAADQASDIDTMCFFLTQAYVFALEMEHDQTGDLLARLQQHRRA